MKRIIYNLLIVCCLSCSLTSVADESADSISTQRKGLIDRVISYFNESNKPHPDRKFDFSVIGGPHYSSDSKFGIGLVASGMYRTDTSTVNPTPQSNISFKFDATTAAHFTIGAEGIHYFKRDERRLVYDIKFESIETKLWGVGYDAAANDANETDYRYLGVQANIAHVWRLGRSLFIGPTIDTKYLSGRHIDNPELILNQDDHVFSLGAGATLVYDTRDVPFNPYEGIYIRFDQRFYPSFIGNKYDFALSELTFGTYNRMPWRGAILAASAHMRMTFGDTPWSMLSAVGGSHNMRGYFEGRYRDKSEIDVCVELRQHVWRRNGIVVWCGGGFIFPKVSDIQLKQFLPNYGLGYRWEFKKRVNVRLDIGFGRHQQGFMFNINEAF